MSIIKGTTPTIQFTFSQINVENIISAFLIIKQANRTIVEKPISEAEIGENWIQWTLSQDESLKLKDDKRADICCDWKLADGTRGRSKMAHESVEETGKNEII